MTDFIIRPVRLPHLHPVRKTFIVFIDNKKKERWKSGRFPLSFLLEDSFGRLSGYNIGFITYLSFFDNTCVVRQKVFFTSLATSLQLGILFKERRTGKS